MGFSWSGAVVKQWLAIVGLGAGLFVAAVIGTLAIQGRLDAAGVRGVPWLGALFPDAQVDEPGAPESATAIPAAPLGEQAVPPTGPAAVSEGAREPSPASFLESGLDVERIERLLRAAEVRDRTSREREAAVARRERELDLRQADLQDREEAVAAQMLGVDRERQRLEERIAQFEKDVLIVHADDARALRDYAHTLVALDPERAAAVLEREWQDEEGRKRIARVLSLLDSADVGPVLDHLSVERTREVLLERLKVVRGY